MYTALLTVLLDNFVSFCHSMAILTLIVSTRV